MPISIVLNGSQSGPVYDFCLRKGFKEKAKAGSIPNADEQGLAMPLRRRLSANSEGSKTCDARWPSAQKSAALVTHLVPDVGMGMPEVV